MKINTAEWAKGQYGAFYTDQIYNALDCMVTLEVFDEIRKNPRADNIMYDFERALQAPVLEMMLRGVRVDPYEKQTLIADLQRDLDRFDNSLQQFAIAVWGKGLNPRSTLQLQKFFYEHMRLPEQWISIKGKRSLSMNREVLEKLALYFHAMPIVNTIMAYRDTAKKLETVQTEIDADGRMRTALNIAGTDTDRFSSSANAFGTGTNMQNQTRDIRHIYTADPGFKFCGIDLEQAESREVGWICGVLFGDWSYYDACLSGDLHTTVCRYAWPRLPWTGDFKLDRPIAEQIFYRFYTYRDMAKKLGHGSNYYGKPPQMAKHAKIPTEAAEEFQRNYFGAFPCIPKYHRWVAEQLQRTSTLRDIFGRERTFFARANDDTTLRAAIAHAPQSATAKRINLAIWRLWYHMGTRIRLSMQVHDAVYFQYPETADEAQIVREALGHINVSFRHGDRTMSIPGEAKVGWNWGDYNDDPKRGRVNLFGLKKFKVRDDRTSPTFLDRIF